MPHFRFAVMSALGAIVLHSPAHAQSYPSKPVRIVIGFAPGGAVDFTARLFGQKLSESMGQPFVIENRPGAATAISAERVAKAPADGYTLMLLPTSTAVLSAFRTNLAYDLKRDIVPISQVSLGPLMLMTHPSLPIHNVKELVALAHSRPGGLEWSSPGIGSANHFAGEFFNLQSRTKMLHVPFKGSSEAVIATVTGQVGLSYTSVTAALPMLQGGRLRAIAVSSAKRVPALPDIPTIAESGLPGYDYATWFGFAGPGGLAKDLVGRINGELVRIAQLPDVSTALTRQGMIAQTGTPEHFTALVARTIEQHAEIIKQAGLKLD